MQLRNPSPLCLCLHVFIAKHFILDHMEHFVLTENNKTDPPPLSVS